MCVCPHTDNIDLTAVVVEAGSNFCLFQFINEVL